MKRILLLIAPVLLFVLAFSPVKTHTVSGTVTDEAGAPIPGATVMVKGTRSGINTAADGKYKIVAPNAYATLKFSAVGYETLEVRIMGKDEVNVVLRSQIVTEKEIVVTTNQPKVTI